jgi:hypothetical protein
MVKGVLPDGPVTIVDTHWHGSTCIELTYKDAAGRPHTEVGPAVIHRQGLLDAMAFAMAVRTRWARKYVQGLIV